jgi:hypothetical protein
MAAAARTQGRVVAALGAVVLLAVLAAGALDPAPAAGQIPGLPNPIDAVSGLLGGPADVVSGLGADVLKAALEWLLGGLEATITLELVKFLTTIELPVGGTLSEATGPIVVIGGFFLVVGLITSIGDGYREVIAGTDTAPRVIGQAIFRVIGLALLLGAWFWVVPLAVDVANGMSHYVLSDDAVASALRRTFAGTKLDDFPLFWLLTAIFMAMAMLVLVVLKFVIAIAFACLYVGGPALIGFAALPRIGTLPLAIATRGLVTLTLIPLAWTVVFVAWAGVSAGIFDAATGTGSDVVRGLMGPGLFLAGLVVMLAVTKKVLSMASFGLPLSVPGAGIVRSAVIVGGSKELRGAADRVRGNAAEEGGGDAVKDGPRKGGGSQPIRANTPMPESGSAVAGTGSATTRKDRGRPLVLSGGAAPGRNEEWRLRRELRARDEAADEASRNRDAAAIAHVKGGAYAGQGQVPRAAHKDHEARVERVRDLETLWGEPTTDSDQPAEKAHTPAAGSAAGTAAGMRGGGNRTASDGIPLDLVREAAQDLPGGDRAAIGKLAWSAWDEHPNDPVAARRYFQRGGLPQYAGRDMSAKEQTAMETIFAAGPEKAWIAFEEDADKYAYRQPGGRGAPSGGQAPGGYDRSLSNFRDDGGGNAPRGRN